MFVTTQYSTFTDAHIGVIGYVIQFIRVKEIVIQIGDINHCGEMFEINLN